MRLDELEQLEAAGTIWVVDNDNPKADDSKPNQNRQGRNVGAGVAIGVGVGAALFAATSSPVWIGVGAAIGAALGTAASGRGEQWGTDGIQPGSSGSASLFG